MGISMTSMSRVQHEQHVTTRTHAQACRQTRILAQLPVHTKTRTYTHSHTSARVRTHALSLSLSLSLSHLPPPLSLSHTHTRTYRGLKGRGRQQKYVNNSQWLRPYNGDFSPIVHSSLRSPMPRASRMQRVNLTHAATHASHPPPLLWVWNVHHL